MPLISCPDCTSDVSDKAAHCPKCGHPISKKNDEEPQRVLTPDDSYLTSNRGCGDLILYGFLFLVIIAVVMFFGSIL